MPGRVVDSATGAGAGDHPLFPATAAAGGVVCAAIYGRLALAGLGLPMECRWLRWTGMPCPGCGATRCLAACGRLDFLAAWHWHPLVAMLAVAFLAWPALVLAGRVFRVSWPERLIDGIRSGLTQRRILAAIAVNWLYLCWVLPR